MRDSNFTARKFSGVLHALLPTFSSVESVYDHFIINIGIFTCHSTKQDRSLIVDSKFFCQILIVFVGFHLQLFFMFQVLLMENMVTFVKIYFVNITIIFKFYYRNIKTQRITTVISLLY